MPDMNYYEILDVSRNVDEETLREHYLEKLYKYHPDHNQGNEDWAQDQTVLLNKAYQTLCDPAAKRMYDFQFVYNFRDQGLIKGMNLLKSKAKKDAEAQFEKGVRHHRNGQDAKAVECFKASIKLETGFSDAAYNLAWLGAVLGNAMFAMGVLDKAIKADPKDEGLKKLRKGIHETFLT